MKGRKPSLENLKDDPLEQSKFYSRYGYIDKNVKIADGFMDVGMSGSIYDNGTTYSEREIIVVDRKNDKKLNEIINTLKENISSVSAVEICPNSENIIYSPLTKDEQIEYLFGYLKDMVILNYSEGLKVANFRKKPKDVFISVNPNEKVLLGDCIKNMNAQPRHYSLLFKVLADELDIPCKLVKGTKQGNKHAWNIVNISNSRPVIFDVASRCIGNPKYKDEYIPVYKEKKNNFFMELRDKFRRY